MTVQDGWCPPFGVRRLDAAFVAPARFERHATVGKRCKASALQRGIVARTAQMEGSGDGHPRDSTKDFGMTHLTGYNVRSQTRRAEDKRGYVDVTYQDASDTSRKRESMPLHRHKGHG